MCKFMSPDISPLIRFDVPSFPRYIASIFHSCSLNTSTCLYLLSCSLCRVLETDRGREGREEELRERMDPERGGVKLGLRSQIASPTLPLMTDYHKGIHTHVFKYTVCTHMHSHTHKHKHKILEDHEGEHPSFSYTNISEEESL